MNELEQHAVGIAVNDAFHRAVGVVADRVRLLFGPRVEFRRIGDELQRNRVVRIRGVDQFRHFRRQRHRVARRHPLELGKPLRWNQPGLDELGGSPQCFRSRPDHCNFLGIC